MNIEKDFIAHGLRCVVLRTDLGHRCGYVGITQTNALYGKDYSEPCEELSVAWIAVKEGSLEKRGIIPFFCAAGRSDEENATPELIFNVHGGLTFSEGNPTYPVPAENVWWFGFDCAHLDDTEETCTTDYVADECTSLAEQLAAYERIPA